MSEDHSSHYAIPQHQYGEQEFRNKQIMKGNISICNQAPLPGKKEKREGKQNGCDQTRDQGSDKVIENVCSKYML